MGINYFNSGAGSSAEVKISKENFSKEKSSKQTNVRPFVCRSKRQNILLIILTFISHEIK